MSELEAKVRGTTKGECMPTTITNPRAVSARKVRAARGWANLSQPQLAKYLEISTASVRRIEQEHRDVSTAELIRISEICDVPRTFMLYGWPAEGKPDTRTDAIETLIADMAERLAYHERLHGIYHKRFDFDLAIADESQDVVTTIGEVKQVDKAVPPIPDPDTVNGAPDLASDLEHAVTRRTRARRTGRK